MKSHIRIILLFVCFSLVGQNSYSSNAKPCRLVLAELNIHNLFSPADDLGKDDSAFAYRDFRVGPPNGGYDSPDKPIVWTDAKVQIKLNQIKKFVDSMGDELPDVLGVIELEDEDVGHQLATKLGYERMLMTRSPDRRGVDVGLLFNPSENFVLRAKQEHKLEGKAFEGKPTRNILESIFLVQGEYYLHLLLAHFPSQHNPAEARIAATAKIQEIATKITAKNPNARIMLMGDLNTTPEEYDLIFGENILSSSQPVPFKDVHNVYLDSPLVSDLEKAALQPGTYYYDKWDRFDIFFASPNLFGKSGLVVDVPSYQIHAPPFAKDLRYTLDSKIVIIPRPYNFHAEAEKDAGYSDHFGASVALEVLPTE